MGFFSGILGGSPSVSTPATGFYSQSPVYQGLYNRSLRDAANILTPGANGQVNSALFQAPAANSFETAAQNQIQQGVTPTAASLASNIAMQTNPYDSSVINLINNQAAGQNSLVNQAATQAGQQGSNRSFLGTSDVEQNRLNNIGSFQQSEYNTALQNALTTIPGLQQQDINNNLNQGALQRGIDTQNQMAPYSALQALQGYITGTPTSFGNAGYAAQSGIGGSSASLGGILKTAGTLASFF